MLNYANPIHRPSEPRHFFPSDEIIPYGGRIEAVSESKSEEVALELLRAFVKDEPNEVDKPN